MPCSHRLAPSSLKLRNKFMPRPPRSFVFVTPVQLTVQSAIPRALGSTVQCYSVIFSDWKGSSKHDNARERAEKGDKNDPAAEASAVGMEERYVNEGVPDSTKSQAATERGGRKFEKKAKEEHPNAPKPIIGMNDERAEVSVFALRMLYGLEAD